MGLQHVVIECDALNVVNVLQKGTNFFSEMGSISDSCRHILQQRSDLKVKHVQRQANSVVHNHSVVHNLAKLPCLIGTVNSFISPPSCLLEYVLNDSSVD